VADLLGSGQAGVLAGDQANNRVTVQAPSGGGSQYSIVEKLGAASSSQLAPGYVRFDLSDVCAGAAVVVSGQKIQTAEALASGQVVVALADGDVNLSSPHSDCLSVSSILEAQAGLTAAPSAIDVVSNSDGQFNVLVSSAGSDTIFARLSGRGGRRATLGRSRPVRIRQRSRLATRV
jgi:hypothetical protein